MALTKVGKEGITGISNSSDATAITIDSSEKVGIGDTSPLGNKVHIRTAGSATSVNGDAGLVLESDDSTRCDLQFMGPDGAFQSIYFGDVSDDNRGIIAYSHSGNNMRFTVDASERMRLTADGLTFNGDTAASNALDDYEEGNFTATVASGISVSSYDHQIGHYVKVGRMVTAWVFMEYNGSSRTSSHFIISGLPFTSSNDTSNEATMGGFITYQNNFSSAHNIIHVARNNTKAFFYELDGSDLIGSELSGASGEVRFVVQYTVA